MPAFGFEHPLVMSAAAVVAVAVIVIFRRPLRRSFLPYKRTALLDISVVAAIIAALGEPFIAARSSPMTVLHLLDLSASVPDPGSFANRAALLSKRLGKTRHVLVGFAGEAIAAGEFTPDNSESPPPLPAPKDPLDTRPSTALASVVSLTSGVPCPVILYSDGLWSTAERELAKTSAAALRQRGYFIYSVPPVQAFDYDAALLRADCPTFIRPKQTLSVQASVAASGAAGLEITLLSIGEGGVKTAVDSVVVKLPGADSRTVLLREVPPAGGRRAVGTARYEIRLRTLGRREARFDNNSARLVTEVIPKRPRILAVSPAAHEDFRRLPAHAAVVAKAAGFDLDFAAPEKLPEMSLSGYRAVLLDALPADAFPPETWKKLATAVSVRGMGLLYTGGPEAFAAGGHEPGGVLEKILPVTMTPADPRRVLLILVLDASGSMNRSYSGDVLQYRGLTRIDLLKRAVERMMITDAPGNPVKPEDRLLTLFFDSELRNPGMRPIAAADYGKLRSMVLDAVAEGRTNVYGAVAAAVKRARRASEKKVVVLLVSDGRPQGDGDDYAQRQYENLEELLSDRRKTEKWSFSALYMGDASDPDERVYFHKLTYLAREYGGGDCVAVDPAKLYEKMEVEFRKRTRRIISLKPSRPEPEAGAEFLTGGLSLWPPVTWRNRTGLKPSATPVFSIAFQETSPPVKDPWIAAGAAGSGRTAAWCGPVVDPANPFEDRTTVLARLIDYIMVEPERGYSVSSLSEGNKYLVKVKSTGLGNSRSPEISGGGAYRMRRLKLKYRRAGGQSYGEAAFLPVSAGCWEARVERSETGAGMMEIIDAASGRTVARTTLTAGIEPELCSFGTDTGALSETASAGGGRLFDDVEELASELKQKAAASEKKYLTGTFIVFVIAAFIARLLFRGLHRLQSGSD